MMEDRTPERPVLHSYKVDLILGRGGTGTVYRGFDKKGNVFAIKRFHENFFRNQLHLRDLKKSVKRFRKLKHQNVVQIMDFIDARGEDGNCMVMEYMDGPNLKDYILKRPWNFQERLGIVQQICLGLQYLHENGITHHDFKPANVLFTRQGLAKLSDFSLYGSSLLFELFDRGAGDQVTPIFVAPEIIRKEKIGPPMDQYSLGITMYMMFAERPPFMVDSLQKLYRCHLTVIPDNPSDINPKCPPELSQIIMKLLAKYPDKRFRDCYELRWVYANVSRRSI